eukprot:691280-Pleurochrysis_carterae.AAC.1
MKSKVARWRERRKHAGGEEAWLDALGRGELKRGWPRAVKEARGNRRIARRFQGRRVRDGGSDERWKKGKGGAT